MIITRQKLVDAMERVAFLLSPRANMIVQKTFLIDEKHVRATNFAAGASMEHGLEGIVPFCLPMHTLEQISLIPDDSITIHQEDDKVTITHRKGKYTFDTCMPSDFEQKKDPWKKLGDCPGISDHIRSVIWSASSDPDNIGDMIRFEHGFVYGTDGHTACQAETGYSFSATIMQDYAGKIAGDSIYESPNKILVKGDGFAIWVLKSAKQYPDVQGLFSQDPPPPLKVKGVQALKDALKRLSLIPSVSPVKQVDIAVSDTLSLSMCAMSGALCSEDVELEIPAPDLMTGVNISKLLKCLSRIDEHIFLQKDRWLFEKEGMRIFLKNAPKL